MILRHFVGLFVSLSLIFIYVFYGELCNMSITRKPTDLPPGRVRGKCVNCRRQVMTKERVDALVMACTFPVTCTQSQVPTYYRSDESDSLLSLSD